MAPTDLILPAHHEVLRGMQSFVGENLNFLGEVDRAWQPTDYLPDLAAENWHEQVEDFRKKSREISDELLVVLVGDMVTEEALPSYSVSLNHIAQDHEGDRDSPWAKWLRGWTAEENRHGDLLNAYLRLTGRVNMRAVEVTVNHLIANGFNPKAYPDPYNGLIYTSFQERATKISHRNAGRMVAAQGDTYLAKICQRIAGDESRHEAFYTKMMRQVMEVDPNGGVLAFRSMLRGIIAMPGRLMYDGKDPDLFDHFAVIAQRTGVYTVYDYAAIIGHLVEVWDIAGRLVTGPAAKAQEYLCRQAERYVAFADEVKASLAAQPAMAFSWIHDRKI
ncbi:MAG TPA: acyl-ACP desaturase [Phycisphaerae bacterium]|nr:acyl-ACP desaturase [Phycisphaerae bacterium]